MLILPSSQAAPVLPLDDHQVVSPAALEAELRSLWRLAIATGDRSLAPELSLITDPSGRHYLYGHFYDDQLTIGDSSIPGSGQFDRNQVLPGGAVAQAQRSRDGVLARINDDGSLAWAHSFAADDYDRISPPQFDAVGNLYIGGNFRGSELRLGPLRLGQTGGAPASRDVYLAQLSPGGAVNWVTSLSSNGLDNSLRLDPPLGARATPLDGFEPASNLAFVVDAQGHSYVTGHFGGDRLNVGGTSLEQQGGGDAYLAKLNPDGSLAWLTALASGGLDYREYGDGSLALPQLDGAGNLYLTGYWGGSRLDLENPLGNGPSLAQPGPYLAKIDGASGRILWTRGLEITREPPFSQAAPLELENGYLDRLMVDSLGNITLLDQLAGGVRLAIAANGDITVEQVTSRVTLGGQPLTIDGPNQGYFARFDTKGGFVNAGLVPVTATLDAAGQFYSSGLFAGDPIPLGDSQLDPDGDRDAYVAKLNADGSLAWAQFFRSSAAAAPGSERAYERELSAPAVDAAGNVYLTGRFNSEQFSLGSGPGSVTLTQQGRAQSPATSAFGADDTFVAKFTANGDLAWVLSLASDGDDTLLPPQVADDGSLYISGSFRGSSLVVGNSILTQQGSLLDPFNPPPPQHYVARLTADGTVAWVDSTDPIQEFAPNAAGEGTLTSLSQAGDRYRFSALLPQPPRRNPQAPNDFNGDGRSDVILRNRVTGTHLLRYLDGDQILQTDRAIARPIADPDWRTQASGDFTGDGQDDILLRHGISGQILLFAMDNATLLQETAIGRTVSDPNWDIFGSGDFNGDGQDDILWHNAAAGQTLAWYVDRGQVIGEALVGRDLGLDSGWHMAGSADFNGDRQTDLLLRHGPSGQVLLWFMDGGAIASERLAGRPVADPDWQIAGAGDFNGDGQGDIFWRYLGSPLVHPETNRLLNRPGSNLIWLMQGAAIAQERSLLTIPDTAWQALV